MKAIYTEGHLPSGDHPRHHFSPKQRTFADAVAFLLRRSKGAEAWKAFLGELGVTRGRDARRHPTSLLNDFLVQQGATCFGDGALANFTVRRPPSAATVRLWCDQTAPSPRVGDFIETSSDDNAKAVVMTPPPAIGGPVTYTSLPPASPLGPVLEVATGDGRVSVRVQQRWIMIWKQHTESTLGIVMARVRPTHARTGRATRASGPTRQNPSAPLALIPEESAVTTDTVPGPAAPAWRQDRESGASPTETDGQSWQWNSRSWNWTEESWNWDAPATRWASDDYGRAHGSSASSSASGSHAWHEPVPWRGSDRHQDAHEPRRKRPRYDASPTTYIDWDEAERVAAAIQERRMDPGETTDSLPLLPKDLADFIDMVKKEDRPPSSGNWRSRWLEWVQCGRRTGRLSRDDTTTDAANMPCPFLWEFICWYRLDSAFSVYCSAAMTVAAASRISNAASARPRHG